MCLLDSGDSSSPVPLPSVAGVTSGSLLLLPAPWMSVHFMWQRLPEQSRWARNCFCCTGLSKYSNYAEICLKWRCCWNPGKDAQTKNLQCSIEWIGPVWSMNALVQPSSQQHPMAMLSRESSRRDNSQYGNFTGLFVWLFLWCYHWESHGRSLYGGFFQLISCFSLVSLAVLEILTR